MKDNSTDEEASKQFNPKIYLKSTMQELFTSNSMNLNLSICTTTVQSVKMKQSKVHLKTSTSEIHFKNEFKIWHNI